MIFNFRPLCLCLFAVLFEALAPVSFGQVTGTISGFVKDPSGAAVESGSVTATLIGQQTQRTVATNGEGFYTFTALTPGTYTLTAEKAGFDRLVHSGVSLALNQNVRVDFALQLGQVSQQVSVSGQAALVDTTSGALSSMVDTQRVVDLPLNGRNVMSLTATLPGVVNVLAPQQLTDTRSGPTMNVNGGLETENLFTFNGGIFVNPSRNTGLNYPPPDAIQEISIQAQNFSAEYGRNSGGQVNVVSKSGTNEFHGSAFEFLRNDDLNARSFFAKAVTPSKQNQYGATAGGPIIRNRLFVFGSYQQTVNHGGALSAVLTLPTAAERNGDFTALGKTLTNPVSPITGQPLTSPSGAPCIQGNIINPGCLTTAAKTLLPLIPQSANNRTTTIGPQPQTDNLGLIRLDWNQSSKHTLSGHVDIDNNLLQYQNLISGSIPNYMSGSLGEQTTMVTLNDTYTFTPNRLNQLTVSFLRDTSLSAPSQTITPSSMGVNSPLYAQAGALTFNVGSDFSFGGSSGMVAFTSNVWQFRDAMTWIHGRHNFKFGGEYLHLTWNQTYLSPPSFTFNGTRTGNEIADFLVGAYYQYTGSFGIAQNLNSQPSPSLFFQDEFKIAPRLMLTYGLRWEPFIPWVDAKNRLMSLAGIGSGVQSTVFPDAPPGLLFAGDPGVPRGLGPARWNYFAPRVGFAWDVFGDGRTSVRGGYGIYYDATDSEADAEQSAPWTGIFSLFNGYTNNPFGSVGSTVPPVTPTTFGCTKTSTFPGVNCPLYPLPLGGLYTGSNLLSPYIQSWNLTVERQLAPTLLAQVAYVGNAGIHENGWQSVNPAVFKNDPVTGAPPSERNAPDRTLYLPGILSPSVLQFSNPFRSWYNSLQIQLIKRMSHGLSFNAAYTFSKSIDYISNNFLGYQYDNPFNLNYQRGLADFNHTHVFVLSWLWSPRRNFGNRFANAVLNNWTFSAIDSFETGHPFTVYQGTDVALDGTGSRQHAQLAPGANVQGNWTNTNQMLNEYFNTAAFVPPARVARGTYGNSPRNPPGLNTPGLTNTDFSVLRDFDLSERFKLQFRGEFFNVFNTPFFGCQGGNSSEAGGCNNPVNTATSSNFGQLTVAGPGRVIQFALKLRW